MKDRGGFTIVELLVVIVIIGVLAAITTVMYIGIERRAKDAATDANIANIRKVVESYIADRGNPPYCPGSAKECPIEAVYPALRQYESALPVDKEHPYQWHADPNEGDSWGVRVYKYSRNGYCRAGKNMQQGWWGGIAQC